MRHFGLLHLGLEANGDGKAENEIEYTSYGRIESFSVLDRYEYEDHVQAEFPVDADGLRMRIRSVNEEDFLLCVKKARKEGKGSIEAEIEITQDMFNLLLSGVKTAVYKRRYFIPHDKSGLMYEIDVFTKQDGQRSSWVKVDLEVPNDDDVQIPHVPFALNDLIDLPPEDFSDEQQEHIHYLWDTEWSVKISED